MHTESYQSRQSLPVMYFVILPTFYWMTSRRENYMFIRRDHRSAKLTNDDRSSVVGCHLYFRALPSTDHVESMPNKHLFSLREVIHWSIRAHFVPQINLAYLTLPAWYPKDTNFNVRWSSSYHAVLRIFALFIYPPCLNHGKSNLI